MCYFKQVRIFELLCMLFSHIATYAALYVAVGCLKSGEIEKALFLFSEVLSLTVADRPIFYRVIVNSSKAFSSDDNILEHNNIFKR